MTTDPAVQAAAEAIRRSPGRVRCQFHREPAVDTCETCLSDAEDARYDATAAVAAARQHIAAAIRAAVPPMHDDPFNPDSNADVAYRGGLLAAARIAEGDRP